MLFQRRIVSPDLCLMAATTEISPALFTLLEQERTYLERWMKWPQRIDTPARCQRYLREMQLINGAGQQFFSFIFYQDQLAGSIALAKIDRQNQVGELGFWKSQTRLPKVQMQTAMQNFILACWENGEIHRLEIQTPNTNLPTKKLSEKLGFQLEGSKRKALRMDGQYVDLDIYGLLIPDDHSNALTGCLYH